MPRICANCGQEEYSHPVSSELQCPEFKFGSYQVPNFKKIKDYSPEELNSSVAQAELYCKDKGLEFYKILNGIDAYFERRRRKEWVEQERARLQGDCDGRDSTIP